MTTDRVAAIEALLAETERAHGIYEATQLGGVYDRDWARWYAAWAVDHDLAARLDREVTADELAQFLTRTWDELQRTESPPGESWSAYAARRIAAELQA